MAHPLHPLPRAYFRPRPLENLALADEIESLNPILDAKVLNLLPNSDTPQIFTLNGRGSRSMLRTLRHGLEVEETVSSDLPGIPNAVWTVKVRSDGEFVHMVPLRPTSPLDRDLRLLYHPFFRERYSCALYRRNDRGGSRYGIPFLGAYSCRTTNRRRRPPTSSPTRHSTRPGRPQGKRMACPAWQDYRCGDDQQAASRRSSEFCRIGVL